MQYTGISLALTLALAANTALGGTTESQPPASPKPWSPGDPIKLGSNKLILDFQLRERYETFNNWIDFNDNARTREGDGLLQRARIGLLWKATADVSFYVQGQDSRTYGYDDHGVIANRELVNNDSPFDLRQAWVEIKGLFGEPLSLKLGRQVLAYGDQRLIGGFEWDNNARTFDAAKLTWKAGGWSVDAFAGYVVLHETESFNSTDGTDLLTGIYATSPGMGGFDSDFYAIYRHKTDIAASTIFTSLDQTDGNTAAPGDYITLGTRWKSKKDAFGPWFANWEAAVQAGTIQNPTGFGSSVAAHPINTSSQDLLAAAVHAEGGYAWSKAPCKPSLSLQYNFATGDDDPSDGTSHTFQNLLPTNHPFYGIMDRFSWQNMQNPALVLVTHPTDLLTIQLEGNAFWLDSTHDVWRNAGQGANGGAARYGKALTGGASSYVGSEIDLVAKYQPSRWCALEGGYAHFFAGSYISDTAAVRGTKADADFAYVQTTFTF